MSMYAMDKQMSAPPIGRDPVRTEREKMPQVREQLEYLAKTVETLAADAQRLLARIAPAQRQEPSGPSQLKDGRCEVSLSAPLASEISAMVSRIESISRDLREGTDLLEL